MSDNKVNEAPQTDAPEMTAPAAKAAPSAANTASSFGPAPASLAPSSVAPRVAAPVTPSVAIPGRTGSKLALLLAASALVLSASQPWWSPYVSAQVPALAPAPQEAPSAIVPPAIDGLLASTEAMSEELTKLQESAPKLEERIAQLEQRPQVAADPALASRLQQLEDSQKLLAAQQAELAALKGELAQLRKEVSPNSQQGLAQKALLAASLQLSAAWQEGGAFEAPWLALLAAASKADPALAQRLNDEAPTILPWRDKGLPTLAQLQQEYPAAARAVVTAALPEGSSWWQQSWRSVRGLVTIRRDGAVVTPEDNSVDAVLARAGQYVQQGELKNAAAELDKLDSKLVAPMKPWLEAARARIAARALSSLLIEQAGSYLTAGTPAAAQASPSLDELEEVAP